MVAERSGETRSSSCCHGCRVKEKGRTMARDAVVAVIAVVAMVEGKCRISGEKD